MSIPADGMTADALAAVDELLRLRGQPIALIPATGTVTVKPGGGKDYSAGTARDPQIFAKFNTHSRDGDERAQTDQGTTRTFQFRMIGAPDAVVELGDSWEDSAAKYQVDVVDNTQPYQITAWCTATLKVAGHSFG